MWIEHGAFCQNFQTCWRRPPSQTPKQAGSNIRADADHHCHRHVRALRPKQLAMMSVTASLVQWRQLFQQNYADKGIHVSICIGRNFPHIKESGHHQHHKIHPPALPAAAKDLVRLISWRSTLHGGQKAKLPFKKNRLEDFDDMMAKNVVPVLRKKSVKPARQEEDSFPYILRHTQMRPRQLVILCNNIARTAERAEKFRTSNEIAINRPIADFEYIWR